MLAAWGAGYTPLAKEGDHYVSLLMSKVNQVSATQTTVTAKITNKYEGVTYKWGNTIIEDDTYLFTGYMPNTENTVKIVASIGNATYEMSGTLVTKDLGLEISSHETASSIEILGKYQEGDATVTKQEIKLNGVLQEGNTISLKGLDPDKNYTAEFTVYVPKNTWSSTPYTFTTVIRTATANLVAQQPKVASPGNVVVAATTNLDYEEENVGFEWRRTDWTDEFNSNRGVAYLYEGTMEGYIRNLNTEKLWKFRPYYISDSGQTYYGEWLGLDPTNTSYFEPTVHTYAQMQVEGNMAIVKGYVMRGSDNVTQQGFIYWTQTAQVRAAARVKSTDIPSNAQIVEASGNIMTAQLTNLEYNSTYCCVAFVKTSEGETFYGELQTFETEENPTGIGTVLGTGKVCEVARYDLRGHRLQGPEKGVNIIRMSDGSTKKVFVK